jgi:hypothetical protein
MFSLDVFEGMCGENSCEVFILPFMVLWASIFATLCMRAMLMLWHAFMLLGLRPVGFSSFPPYAWCFPLPFLVRIFSVLDTEYKLL